ncbi:hypothetical protein GF324_12715 [bacterium]|nr:hypothetical protein [bacterium]
MAFAVLLSGCTDDGNPEREEIIPNDFAGVWFLWVRVLEDGERVSPIEGSSFFDIDVYGNWEYFIENELDMYGSSDWNDDAFGTRLRLTVQGASSPSMVDSSFSIQLEYSETTAMFSYSDAGGSLIDVYARPIGTTRAVAGVVRTLEQEPIANADIIYRGSNGTGDDLIAATDDYGYFYTTEILTEDSVFTLEADAVGYLSRETEIDLRVLQLASVDFVLEPSP